MIKRLISKLIRAVIPKKILVVLFPSKYISKPFHRRFISIDDPIANRPFQMYLREDSMIEGRVLSKGLYGDWEKESLKIWAELSKGANTIIDIGANTGIYTLIAQNNNRLAKVIAIEPVEINFSVLSSNIRQNDFAASAEQIALSDTEGTAKMFMIKDHLNYMTSVNDNRYALHPEIQGDNDVIEIQVPMRSFSYVNDKYRLNKIDLVKIDVEGHEITVLNSMLSNISQWKPVILIEIIGDKNAETLDRMFRNLDYRFISINESSKSVVVNKLWDNDHHNFLICHDTTIGLLKEKGLVV